MRSNPSASALAERRFNAHALAASLPNALWRADALGSHATASICSGYSELNHELPGGGWPTSALTELLWTQQGGGEFRLLAPVLASLSREGRTIVLLAPPHLVFAPALVQLGIDIRRVLLIQSEKPADRLWAVEQVLKSGSFGALLCWLPQARPEHLRRLQVVATGGDGLSFVFRRAAAQLESSPAPLRLLCQAAPSGQISVKVIKRRGPAASSLVILRTQLPSVVEKTIARLHVPAHSTAALPGNVAVDLDDLSAGSSHAMDRPVPAAAAAGPCIPPLA